MTVVRRFKVQRCRTLPEHGGRTLFLSVFLGSRSRGWLHFRPNELPDFEGEEAWFEMERVKGRWRIVRQVEPPG